MSDYTYYNGHNCGGDVEDTAQKLVFHQPDKLILKQTGSLRRSEARKALSCRRSQDWGWTRGGRERTGEWEATSQGYQCIFFGIFG